MPNKNCFIISLILLLIFSCTQPAFAIRNQEPTETQGVGEQVGKDLSSDQIRDFKMHELKRELHKTMLTLEDIKGLPSDLENKKKRIWHAGRGLTSGALTVLDKALLLNEFIKDLDRYVEQYGIPDDLDQANYDKLAQNIRIIAMLIKWDSEDSDIFLLESPIEVNMASLFNNLSGYFKDELPIELNIEEGLPVVVTSYQGLWAVISNLLRNSTYALEDFYGEDKTLWPAVVISISKDESGFLIIQVEDRGSGIRPDVLPRIFEERFTTNSEKGTGIGLSLCKYIIEKLGGDITCKSDYFNEPPYNHGTTFIIRLPATVGALAAGAPGLVTQDFAPSRAGIEQDL